MNMTADFVPERNITIYKAVKEYLNKKEAVGTLSPKSVHNRKYELNRLVNFCKFLIIEKMRDILNTQLYPV